MRLLALLLFAVPASAFGQGLDIERPKPTDYRAQWFVPVAQPKDMATVFSFDQAAAGCAEGDDIFAMRDAMKTRDAALIGAVGQQRGCLVVFDGSHGIIVGASPDGGGTLRVRFEYLVNYPGYNSSEPVEMFIDVHELRGVGGRSHRLLDHYHELMAAR